jgi:LysR family nitrogen assimilation transcriptional regulator
MDLRQITAFVAVYEVGSINRAAQRLAVAQPSLSAAIRNLEEELAATLFERQARGTKPTPAADIFYRHCQRILSEVDAARKAVTGSPDRVGGPVNVGLAPTAAKGLIP